MSSAGPGASGNRAEVERALGRQQRVLAAEQNRLADIDDTPIGSIRRRAAALYIVAALEHEKTADDLDRDG